MTRNLFLAFVLLAASGSSAWAQLVGSGELYGEGVHRYFARDYQGADELLSRAIEAGSQDPRAHYFRGLAREAYGGGGEIDFEEGARLEASGRSGPMIGFSLARVQGIARNKLEKARRDARVQAAQQRALMQKAAPPAAVTPVPPTTPDAADPFKSGEGVRSADTQTVPEVTDVPKSDATTNPFGDEPMKTEPATPADPSDPFADPSAPTTPATDPAAADDPFK
jgi:hypothetical protein